MNFRRLFPCLLAAAFVLSLPVAAVAQKRNPDDRQRYALEIHNPLPEPAGEPEVLDERAPLAPSNNDSAELRFQTHLFAAIESHHGAPYRYNTTGPNTFDCSGLVWRTFNDIGVNFTRGPARSYWTVFEAPSVDEQFKAGTLVFFSGLTHVGIVADAKGFYHASRRNGVIYSPFSEYWLSRIDGFRRVPLEGLQPIAMKRQSKPAVVNLSDEGTPR
ncbi:MAG TPA: C40 family peptidase [Pyrinomonadaceae bacterium]|nr:C40 family peptidase [Pyrinomonadaceae bacterium]